MNNFVLVMDKHRMMYPGTSYIILIISVWTTLVCWVASLITMLCRILFVADFQLVRVTVKSTGGPSKSSEYSVIQSTNDDGNQLQHIS
jgi:hypothetical protein